MVSWSCRPVPHRIWVGRLLFLIMVLVGSSYHFLVPASSSIEVMTTSRKNYRWAIVTTTNKSFLDFFLNWLSHYESLGLDVAVYVIAEDRATNETLQCIDGINVVDTELDLEGGTFGSDGYKTLVSKRPGQILQVWGLTPTEVDALLYVDMDTIWLDNVFPEVEESLLDHDLANPTDGRRYISKQGDFNTGFIAIPKTEWNKHFMKTWQAEIENNPQPNQPIYNQLVLSEKMRVAKLNSWHFPDGRMYYNHPWKAWAKVVHNNAIGRGHEKKKKKFVDNTLWTIKPRYKELMETYYMGFAPLWGHWSNPQWAVGQIGKLLVSLHRRSDSESTRTQTHVTIEEIQEESSVTNPTRTLGPLVVSG